MAVKRLQTVDTLVAQVRSQIDEDNVTSISTDADILPALNRAQDFGADILSRHYEEPLLRKYALSLSSGVQEYFIPNDVFEDRIEKIEISIANNQQEVQRISYRDISVYESACTTSAPLHYALLNDKIRLVPAPTGTYSARIWYLRNPEALVLSQGRITSVNAAQNYVLLDELGTDLSASSDNLASYVNLVNGRTGEIKASMQIQQITSNQVKFKSVPARDEVLGRTIQADLADLTNPDSAETASSAVSIEADDYICAISGSCVLSISLLSNFLIQYAVSEMKRKLDKPADTELSILKKFEDQVERTWTGRESSLRVKKRSKFWSRPVRRWYTSG